MHNKYVYQKAIQFNLELRNRYLYMYLNLRFLLYRKLQQD